MIGWHTDLLTSILTYVRNYEGTTAAQVLNDKPTYRLWIQQEEFLDSRCDLSTWRVKSFIIFIWQWHHLQIGAAEGVGGVTVTMHVLTNAVLSWSRTSRKCRQCRRLTGLTQRRIDVTICSHRTRFTHTVHRVVRLSQRASCNWSHLGNRRN